MDEKKYTFFFCEDCYKKINFPVEEKTIGGGAGFCTVCQNFIDTREFGRSYWPVLTRSQVEKITGKKVVSESDNRDLI